MNEAVTASVGRIRNGGIIRTEEQHPSIAMNLVRALAAVILSLVFPGAGHLLVRDWIRAFFFASFFVAMVVLFLPLEAIGDAAIEGSFTDAAALVESETSTIEQLTLYSVVMFAAFHAGLKALGLTEPPGGDGGGGEGCPHCGKPLDNDLSFCHWCTTRLEVEEETNTGI